MKLVTVHRLTTATHLAAEMVERMVTNNPMGDLDMEALILELEEELKHIRMRCRVERGADTYEQIQARYCAADKTGLVAIPVVTP